jgi:hypothetical protein
VYAALGGIQFQLQSIGGGRNGARIQGHVHQGGDAARSSGLGGGVEAFPFGSAGLVDVHVAVDEAWKYAGIGDAEIGLPGRLEMDARNFPALQFQPSFPELAIQQNLLTMQQEALSLIRHLFSNLTRIYQDWQNFHRWGERKGAKKWQNLFR